MELPPLQYWFSGSALFLATSFAFGVVVGFVGIKDMISLKLFYILLTIGLLLTVAAWYSAASDAQDSADTKAKLTEIANAIHISPDSSAASLAAEILKRLPDTEWHLTADQKTRLGAVLDSVPVADRFTVEMHVLASDGASRVFGDEILTLFKQHHWEANGTIDFDLRPNLKGVWVGVANGTTKETAPKSAGVLSYVLAKSGIKYASIENALLRDGQVELDIGLKPDDWPVN
ncbi:MAG: hypothetical protein WDN08_07655 [Rhizomicrobium sp.]